MKIENLPDYAKQYKRKGYDVRLIQNSYQLFKIHSVRVQGKKYPVLKSIYIGTIDQEKGLIEKKTFDVNNKVEYGLSSFILKHFKRVLCRSLFNSKSYELIYLSVINFIYGFYEERFIDLCYLKKYKNNLMPFLNDNFKDRIKRLTNKIHGEFNLLIGDDKDRTYLINLLRNIRIDENIDSPKIEYLERIKQILRKYKINE